MSRGQSDSFNTEKLNPDLLSSPFIVQTQWHVITGSACTGKTTLIELLAQRGFQTVAETAREYFERELATGRIMSEISADMATVQRGILDLQLKAEAAIRPEELVFFDRAIPDSLSFNRVHGLDTNEILPDCFRYRYASVFILERLPLCRQETLGPEDAVSSRFLDEWLVRDYVSLGYDVVRVPALAPGERVSFVLENLSRRGLI